MKKINHISNKFAMLSLFLLLGALVLIATVSSCKKYLDLKPDKTLVVPSTLQDLQALLDNFDVMTASYPYAGELATDDNYFTDADWANLYTQQDKDTYTWNPDAQVYNGQWLGPYQTVYQANLILETLGSIPVTLGNKAQWDAIKGSALFFRAYAFYELAQLFALPYDPATAGSLPGIPLRLSSDIYAKTTRAGLQQTYDQVLSDLRLSLALLPDASVKQARPTLAAAYGELARVYLVMGDYKRAGLYADSCLQKNDALIDYNTVDPTSSTPFQTFNEETIVYTLAEGSDAMVPPTSKTDTSLYASYAGNDLRKSVYYQDNGDGTFSFKGGYDGFGYGTVFTGIATDEMLLVRAECLAREGNTDAALKDLNTLLKQRFVTGTFIPVAVSDANDALQKILTERRKELVFRGLRWTDLRRLNLDKTFAVTLFRHLNGKIYQLPPNDLRYALLIPEEVIQQSGIEQNKR